MSSNDIKWKYAINEQQRRTLVLCLECMKDHADYRIGSTVNKFDITSFKVMSADINDLLEMFGQ